MTQCPTPQQDGQTIRTRDALRDCFFLSVVVLLSLVLYVRGLGFYSDDWAWLAALASASDQTPAGLARALFDDIYMRQRPVEIFYKVGLYRLFGLQPLGYHLVNGAVLLTSTLLFYLALREMGQPRLLTLTVPLVWVLLPHYSTARFWAAAFAVALSIALYFLSLYADLRAFREPVSPRWGWKVLGLLSLLGSGLAYEVALPLFLLNPLLVWYAARQRHGPGRDARAMRANAAISVGSTLLAVLLVAGFKALITVRLGIPTSYLTHLIYLVKGALVTNYGTYGLGLPYFGWWTLHHLASGAILGLGGVLGIIIFNYLASVARQPETELPRPAHWFGCVAVGLVVFGLGYAIFLTNANIEFPSAGMSNRVAIAAAVGVALSLVGGLGWVSGLPPTARWRRRAFCLLVTLLGLCGFLIVNTLATFWVAAYRQEQAVLADIRARFPTLPAGSAVILDGVCPYVGPAVVFDSDWDLAGALILAYGEPTLRADVVTPRLQVGEESLSTTIYGGLPREYPYDERLLLYHFARKTVYPLPDAEAARRYFAAVNPDRNGGCPPGQPGSGTPVLPLLPLP